MDDINEDYFTEDSIASIKEKLSVGKFKAISLHGFLDRKLYKRLGGELIRLQYKEVRNPGKQIYRVADAPKNIINLLNSEELLDLVSKILDREVSSISAEVIMLPWKSYSVLHDETQEKSGTDLILDFSEGWELEFGGSIIYTDGEGNYELIPATGNSLSIIIRDKNQQKYFQYVNNLSKGNHRMFVLCQIHSDS